MVRAALDSSVAAWNRGDIDAHVVVYADSAVLLPATGGRGPAQATLLQPRGRGRTPAGSARPVLGRVVACVSAASATSPLVR
jgi:hypothetical protein